jgi:hypothetical protein
MSLSVRSALVRPAPSFTQFKLPSESANVKRILILEKASVELRYRCSEDWVRRPVMPQGKGVGMSTAPFGAFAQSMPPIIVCITVTQVTDYSDALD